MTNQTHNIEFVDFLVKVFPFSYLEPVQLFKLSGYLERVRVETSEQLYSKGDSSDYLYILENGKVEIIQEQNRSKKVLATLESGDIFGESCIEDTEFPETAVAVEPSSVIRLRRDLLTLVLQENPNILSILTAIHHSRMQMRERRFKWLRKDEVLYYFVRQHPFFLLLKMIIPALLSFGFLYLFIFGFRENSQLLLLAASSGFLLMGLFQGWLWLDWSNDFYAVTNRRVMWVEKILLLYDGSQEAPLDTILSSNIRAFRPLRWVIDYGTVEVRTYTGEIPMTRIQNPDLMVNFVDGLRSRAEELVRITEKKQMDALIGEKLGIKLQTNIYPDGHPLTGRVTPKGHFSSKSSGGGLINLRTVMGDSVTYRKHWFVLLSKIWWQTFLMAVLTLLFVFYVWTAGIEIPTALIFLALIFVAGILGLYSYIDWKNDIYVITRDQILDIERKPLGSEDKKTAPLENILSLEHNRFGLLGLMMNFGTVTINIGTEKFLFRNVYNPAGVQREIFSRLTALQRQRERDKIEKDRERIADFLVAYHRQNQHSPGGSPTG
jgi:hypothetical protein